MAESDDGAGELSAEQAGRLSLARRRWLVRSVLLELALAAALALSLFSTPWLVPDPLPVIAMVVAMGVTMGVVVPVTHLSPNASHRSVARRHLAVIAEQEDLRRVSAALREGRALAGQDLAIAQAQVDVAAERQRAVRVLLVLTLVVALVVSAIAWSDGHPAPWVLDGVAAVSAAGLVWQTVRLSRLLSGARNQGVEPSKRP